MICRQCHTDKSENDFHWKNKQQDKKHVICKTCACERSKRHRRQNIEKYKIYDKERQKQHSIMIGEFLWNYKLQHPCACGESDPLVLDFDHIKDKAFGIAAARWQRKSLEAIRQEIAKCVVRCANCHRRKTANEQGWWTPNKMTRRLL